MSQMRAASISHSGGHRLCVMGSGNLRKTDLQGAFSEFGDIVGIETPKPGLAFVVFKDRGDAREALSEMDGGNVNGSKVSVTWAEVKQGSAPSRGRDWQKETPRSEQGASVNRSQVLSTKLFQRDMAWADQLAQEKKQPETRRKKKSRSPSGKRQRERSRSTSRQRHRSRDRRQSRSSSR
mmetsp:Transcript_90142/g.160537  ORF Transcript_90142/g.160537 Transcript_90142/m.160537 type:complete len:180 (+) Transcript_90142:61-600(+)